MAPDTKTGEMRAVRFHDYGPPSVLVTDVVARPEPRAGEVLLRVRTAGVNPMDWKFRAGFARNFMPIALPYTPGIDVAGTVEEVGPGVTEFAPGEEVFGRGSGTYAENAIAPAMPIARKSSGISYDEAAALAPQVGPTFPLEHAVRAHALSETAHGRGRIVL